MSKSNEPTGYSSSTLANGLTVLETTALVGQKKGVTLQEVTKALGMHRSNVYRYLKTLVECGWLEYDSETFRYRIGGKPLQIAGASLHQLDLRTIARPFLQDLAEDGCLAVHLAVLNEACIVYIDKVDSNSPIQMRSRPGMTAPAYCTGIGKALLSTLSSQRVKALFTDNLSRRTRNTITKIDDLLLDLSRTRERGYALDMEENEDGIGCVAATIYGYDDDVVGAISLATLIRNLTPDSIPLFGNKVMRAASRISQSMGCHHNHWSIEVEPIFTYG